MLKEPHPRAIRLLSRWHDGLELLAAAREGDRRAKQILERRGVCCTCYDRVVRLRWVEIAGGRQQIRACCRLCGRHLYWAPQTPDVIELANRPTMAAG